MTLTLEEIEMVRGRWRRTRELIGLGDPGGEGFGQGGLVAHVDDVGVRFLVLPADPEHSQIHFEGDFWEWWMENRPNPFEGAAPTAWGNQSTPTAHSAVRFNQQNGKWSWRNYLALHRNGGLEFGLGEDGVEEWGGRQEGETHRGFFLTTIVGRIWVSLNLYRDVVTRYEAVSGPWEVNLVLVKTKDALLGNVAAGWRDFNGWSPREPPRCPDPHLQFRLEIEEWPNDDQQMNLAFQFGGMIEDAWGVRDRRWLIDPRNAGAGNFDVSRYR
ncbi:MAG: hypothetical protein ACRDGU_01645 [Actinomycetota bacterium]